MTREQDTYLAELLSAVMKSVEAGEPWTSRRQFVELAHSYHCAIEPLDDDDPEAEIIARFSTAAIGFLNRTVEENDRRFNNAQEIADGLRDTADALENGDEITHQHRINALYALFGRRDGSIDTAILNAAGYKLELL